MASSADPAIADLLDDLDLQRVILQSLNESRPDAVEQRRETMDTIRELETKLAELRGEVIPRNSAHPYLPSQATTESRPFQTQPDPQAFPSALIPSSPPQFGRPAFSSIPVGSRPPTLEMPGRKRNRHDFSDDEEDPVGLGPSKRAMTGWPVHSPAQSASYTATTATTTSSTPSDHRSPSAGSNTESDANNFLEMFGLDKEVDLREIQEEHERAEKWLEARKEQERQDAEFARRLMEGFDSPRASSSAQLPPMTSRPAAPLQSTLFSRPSQHLSSSPARPAAVSPAVHAPSTAATLPPIFHGPELDSASSPSDSYDDDIAEITAREFPSRNGLGSAYQDNFRHIPQYPILPQPIPNGLSNGPPPYYNPAAGPSNYVYPGSSMWAHPANAALATYNAAKDRLGGLASSLAGPYRDVIDLVEGHLGNSYTKTDMANIYEYGADPKQLNEEIKQLLETIRPDADISEQEREGIPEALKYTLLDHQKLGLAWMKSKEECDQKGGILADDMGLGKTMQAIALMVARPPTSTDRKTTLIIAPVALMQQWKREIQRMLRPGKHQLTTFILHNEKRSTSFRDLKQYDVVLTTFGTLSSELKRLEEYEKLLKEGAEEPTLRKEYLSKLPCLGPTSKWYRVIIDEAQCIKNRRTKAATACCRLNTTYRWCMSGTPMMNSVEELHSLLKFLRIRPYANLDTFNRDFTRPLKCNQSDRRDKAMTQLRVLLKAVLLRRTKTSKINGKPILNLPARVTDKVHATFSEDEHSLYQALENKTRLQFNRYLEAGTVGRNYSNILVLLLRLRQACCHPHLIRDFGVKLNEAAEGIDYIANAKMFGEDVIVRLRDNDDLECPICIDAVENPVIFFPCGHSTCTECFASLSDPSLLIQQGIDALIKCPNCRGVVDPKKITDHTSFRKVHFPDSIAEESDQEAEEAVANDESETETDDSDSDSDSDSGGEGTLSDFIVNDDDDESAPRRKDKGNAKGKGKDKGKGKGKAKLVSKPKRTLAELKKEAARNQASKRKYLRRLEKTWITSAKIEKTMEILRGIQNQEDSEKTIIFSQFTSLLDLLEVPIAREGHQYRRYDGSMKPADRNSAVLDFTDNPDCKIMLVSLKAGNSGLNLVAASHVILFDPFWNPYIEEQAIDRAHRIGQLREVKIHRILIPETVEDRIIELQDKKRELIDGALDEKAAKNVARLSARELGYLFGIKD
ncbi:SNF2 family N-terminal domain-containing protein [Aspergillus karnatakaensis]|uniref:SNF2 family N-terminal domain-containing protein n=1 Tax=Aspergillus karnatakaensis TaxID=1810916 RepID=UPI003CCE0538